MNILFLGLLYDEINEQIYLNNSKIGLQSAINTFQWNLIDGLQQNRVVDSLNIINALPVGTFPKYYSKLLLPSKKWTTITSHNHFEIGCINLPIIKQISRNINYLHAVSRWIKKTEGVKYILAYGLYQPCLEALRVLKKRNPKIIVTIIVADLPSTYGVLSRNPFLRIIQKFQGDSVLNRLSFVDSFVILTEAMKRPLNIGTRSYVVMEGLVGNSKSKEPQENVNSTERVILYTGTLHYQFGIKDLLEAFSGIEDNNFRLWICGSGEAELEIKEISQKDSRVVFYGHVTREQVHRLQSLATVLINPRKNEGEYTKYSFPSKTMEYMASGKPVIMYQLDGVPKEYDQYLFYVGDNTIDTLKCKMVEVCSKSVEELNFWGQRARDWVLHEKNNVNQAQKVLNMLTK